MVPKLFLAVMLLGIFYLVFYVNQKKLKILEILLKHSKPLSNGKVEIDKRSLDGIFSSMRYEGLEKGKSNEKVS